MRQEAKVVQNKTIQLDGKFPRLRYAFDMTRHCWKCGTEWTLSGQPGRSEQCATCRNDLRVCLNCVSYDKNAAQQCRDRRADPVYEKHVGTFCEWFEMPRREFSGEKPEDNRAAKAREELKRLFGD
ncbi:MAG: hypothetical protein CMO80_20580 [Verrucomicrobiales bacterium]|nr:hypothetical protein [Verrucomicrobiales bacterium]|tara:strand:- start:73 stop:450 length:378 start_codon:yes stop_codon:yes gene_type:complete